MTTMTPEHLLALVQQLPPHEQRQLALQLQDHLAATLPTQATIREAVELYLADACSLGRAAELAGVTRWDILAALEERGLMQRSTDSPNAAEIDALAERLGQQGILSSLSFQLSDVLLRPRARRPVACLRFAVKLC